MLRTLRPLFVAVVAALSLAGTASASGGTYVFDGGTVRERAQVRAALNVSTFDWNLVPQVTIHIERGRDSAAAPGEIWLDARLLDAGVFSWGVVQHEYAHEVDFFLLDDVQRAQLLPLLGGLSWWPSASQIRHDQLASERFASTLAWSYWPSSRNSMRPVSQNDESAAVTPQEFRALIAETLAASEPSPGA